MSLKCRVFRDEKGQIDFVNTSNGIRSKLFDKLVDMTGGNKNTALNLYALTEVDEFKDATEAKVKALKERYDRMVKIAPSTSPKVGEVLSGATSNITQAIQRNNNLPLNLAPNGESSILYQSYKDLGYSDSEAEKLTAQVYSDDFKQFYKGSLLLDKNKQPVIMFHGTNAIFTVFDTTEDAELGRKDGIWDADYPDGYMFFTSSEKDAKYYGKNTIPVFLSLPYAEIKKVEKGASLVKPFDDGGLAFEGDAITTNGDIFVAGTTNEFAIKSATENTGAFSTENNDIRFSRNQGEQSPKEVLDQVTDRLEQSGLAKNVYKMTNSQIEAKLVELGVKSTILDSYISNGKVIIEC